VRRNIAVGWHLASPVSWLGGLIHPMFEFLILEIGSFKPHLVFSPTGRTSHTDAFTQSKIASEMAMYRQLNLTVAGLRAPKRHQCVRSQLDCHRYGASQISRILRPRRHECAFGCAKQIQGSNLPVIVA